MKILLVRPVTDKMPIIIPNLGLGYLASQLKKNGYEVEILDCSKLGYDFDDYRSFLGKSRFDVIGFQVFTCDYSSARKMIKMTKELLPSVITVAGGPHISGLPKYTMNALGALDYGIIGEAEIGLVKLCDHLSGKKVDLADIWGLVYRKGSEVIMNDRVVIEKLDEIDMPDWDLINPRSYPIAPQGTFTKRLPVAPIITSRGCPYECTYCGVVSNTGRKFRTRSPENVIAEIELLVNKYGVREIHIEDDNFTLDRARVMKFCNMLIDRKIDISWACPNGVRLDSLDSELLKLMERSGCYSFAIGIESGSPRILQDMNRRVNLETMRQKIGLIASDTKIRMTGFAMAGYPTETMEDIDKTIAFTLSLPLSRVQYSNFLPLPGTKIFDDLVEKKEISLDGLDWDSFQDNRIVYSPPGMPPERLRAAMKKGFSRFYFRPKIMLGLLREIHSFQQFKIVLQRVVDIFQ